MLGLGTLAGLGLGWWLLFHLSAGSASFPVGGVLLVLLCGWLLAARLRAVARKAPEPTADDPAGVSATAGSETPREAPRDTASEPEPKPTTAETLLDMLPVAGGEFLMGSADDDSDGYSGERPRHRVRQEPFLLARTPVTRGQYRQLMGDKAPGAWSTDEDENLPATHISWDAAVDFCNALSEREGLQTAYDGRREPIHGSDGYHLPTEAEWETACRAGGSEPWFWGDDAKEADGYAWFSGNSGNEVHSVGLKAPNPWGFYDLSGNVWEWCQDRYAGYQPGLQVSPTGPETGTERVLRGGSAWNEPRFLRSAVRLRYRPGDRNWNVGFRCARRQP